MIAWKMNWADRSAESWSGWMKMPQPSPWNYLRFFSIEPKIFGKGYVVKTWLGKKRKAKCATVEQAKVIAESWLR